MSIKTDDLNGFIDVVEDILFDEDFIKLRDEKHHGRNNRYNHSLRVALNTYKRTKNSNLDCVSATRGALLHDFFLTKDVGYTMREELTTHPGVALNNAINKFDINDIEKDIIKTHMFPLTMGIPKSREAKLVSLIDKKIAFREIIKHVILKIKLKEINVEDIDFDKSKLKEKEILNIINSKAV